MSLAKGVEFYFVESDNSTVLTDILFIDTNQKIKHLCINQSRFFEEIEKLLKFGYQTEKGHHSSEHPEDFLLNLKLRYRGSYFHVSDIIDIQIPIGLKT